MGAEENICLTVRLKQLDSDKGKIDIYISLDSPLNKTSQKERKKNRICQEMSPEVIDSLIRRVDDLKDQNLNFVVDVIRKNRDKLPNQCEEYVCDFDLCNELATVGTECSNREDKQDQRYKNINEFYMYSNEIPKDPMYAEVNGKKCGLDHEIKETDENWYECWSPDDDDDGDLGTDYMVEED